MKSFLKFFGAIVFSTLVACGGGGSSSPSSPSSSPQPTTSTGSVSGTTIVGAILTLSGATTSSKVADSAGNYSFTGLANGNYTVTPTLVGYSFTPASLAVTVNGANVSSISFVATPNPLPTYSIS